jgi:hypothetical protein
MLLNDESTAEVRRVGRRAGEIGASVAIMPRRVAMLGWIMPAPFVIPEMRYSVAGEDDREKVRDISLGKVSVVQIAEAAASQCSWEEPSALWAAGTPSRIFLMGSLRHWLVYGL